MQMNNSKLVILKKKRRKTTTYIRIPFSQSNKHCAMKFIKLLQGPTKQNHNSKSLLKPNSLPYYTSFRVYYNI